MKFLFPTTVKHLPNNEQIELLVAITYKNKFPGFLNTNALRLNDVSKDAHNNYIYTATTESFIAESFKSRPYLYIPFEYVRSYIMGSYSHVAGVVIGKHPVTYWFENPISTTEIWTALTSEIPIVVKFVHLGCNIPCAMCNGDGVVDWVDNIKFSVNKTKVPDSRYILATHRSNYYIIDNGWIRYYDGDNIIHPCPRCMGLACDGVLKRYSIYDEDKIEMVEFDNKGKMDYRLLIRDSRETIMEVSPWHPHYKG